VKILILSHRHWYYVAYGIERFLPMSKYLTQKGHQVTLIYLPVPSSGYSALHPKYRTDLSFPRQIGIGENFHSKALLVPDLRSRRGISARLGPHVRSANDFARSLQEVAMGSSALLADCDLVHIEYLFDTPLVVSALLLKVLRRVPHIVDFVDLIGPLVRPSKYYRILRRIGYLPTWATVCSDYLMSHLVANGFQKDKLFKIPQGADPTKVRLVQKHEARERLGLDPSQCYVGFELAPWGIFDEYIDLLLSSLREILRHRPDLKMIFIGSTIGTMGRIHEKIRTAGVSENVICTGLLKTDELSFWLGACDILVLPLKNTNYDHAKFPGRLIDYLCSGRPIVAAAVGEARNVVSKGCGLLATPGDPQDFASKISTLLSEPHRMREMGEAARRLAETEYSWRNIADSLEEVYEEVVASR